MANTRGKSGNSDRLYFPGLQNHSGWWLQPWDSKVFAPRKETMTNLHSVLKSRHTTLPTKVHIVKAMVFPVVMYGCESWTIKKAQCWRTDAFELWCWRRLLRVPGLQGDQASHSYRKSTLNTQWKDWCWSSILWPPDVKRWLIGKDPDAGKDWRQGEKREMRWDGWTVSLTQWTWVWANSGR